LVRTLPSNTLMVAILDSEFEKTPAGQKLHDAIRAEGARAYIEAASILKANPKALIETPPEGDDTIKVSVWGSHNGRELSDFTFAQVRPSGSLDAVSFSARISDGDVATDDPVVTICCRCGSPPRDCGCAECEGGRVLCDCRNCTATCY